MSKTLRTTDAPSMCMPCGGPSGKKAGRWEKLQCGTPCILSKSFLIAMVVMGVAGLLLVGIGVTGYLAHLKILTGSFAHLLGAMGNGAIAAFVIGGAMICLAGMGVAIARVKKNAIDRERAEDMENTMMGCPGYRDIPDVFKKYAHKLNMNGQYTIIPHEDKKAMILLGSGGASSGVFRFLRLTENELLQWKKANPEYQEVKQ